MIAAAIATLAACILLYVMFGYPLLLRWLAPRTSKPVQRLPIKPSISIIVPVYNGEKFLAEKLDSLLALDYPRDRMEIWVVSDGSDDRTEQIARSYEAQGVRLLSLSRGGKPAALNAAIPMAKGEILVLTDVRQALSPDSIRLLVESFADPKVGVVSGELIIRKGDSRDSADIGLYWRLESFIRDNLSRIDSMFGATGPFYAIRRSLAVPIPPQILLDDVYLPISAFFRGYRLMVDSRAKAYDYPTSLDTEFRRKVRTLAGNYQILMEFPQLLGPRNRMWFHFVSYKFGRLMLPWCLIAFAAASLALPEPWRTICVAGQIIFYALACLDPVIRWGPLKLFSSPARTFVTMMIAALRALSVFVVPPQSLWHVTSASRKEI